MYDILVVSDDVVGRKMAGPGIRAWELSGCLSRHFKTVLAVPEYSDPTGFEHLAKSAAFETVRYAVENPGILRGLARRSRILLIQGYILSKFPFLKNLRAHIIADLYVPFVLETLFIHRWKIAGLMDRSFIHLNDLRVFNDQIIHGDYFLCANFRQRDLLTGSLLSLNRINPESAEGRSSLDDFISVVPFGISGDTWEKPKQSVLRGKVPGIGEDDIILLWGGVISNWFDPVTLIRALNEALKENPRLKLFFLSKGHPNPLLPDFDMAREAVRAATDLKLRDTSVFFNPGWVEYDTRAGYFLESDIGVSVHRAHLETYFSFRTRILDYLKFRLPVICTEGDELADVVRSESLGLTVPSGDILQLKKAILTLAGDAGSRARIKEKMPEIAARFCWEKTAEPLINHCRRVLAGAFPSAARPRKKELAFVCCPRKETPLRKAAKKIGWRFFQKLPFHLGARIKRLFFQ